MSELDTMFDKDAEEPATPTSLVVLETQTWKDPQTNEEVAVSIPVGARLIMVDPTAEARYLELVTKANMTIAELNDAQVTCDADKGQIVQKIAFVQKLSSAINQHRETYKKPINEYGKYIQDVFKQKLLDPLNTAKDAAKARVDAFDAKLRADAAEQAEEARKRTEAMQSPLDGIDPEAPAPPPPAPTSTVPTKVVTESGTYFSKKVVTFSCADMGKVPNQYTERVLAVKAIQAKAEEATKDIQAEGDHDDIIPGIVVHVAFKGQVRT